MTMKAWLTISGLLLLLIIARSAWLWWRQGGLRRTSHQTLQRRDQALAARDASGLMVWVSVLHVDDGGTANGVAVSGNYIYLANGDDGLRIYSFSNGPP